MAKQSFGLNLRSNWRTITGLEVPNGYMKFLSAVFAFLFIAAGASHVDAKSWRGIVPMKSTRADVRQLLGDGTKARDPGGKYTLANEAVQILYSGKDAYLECAKQLPADLVLRITVTPTSPLRLDSLGLDTKALRTVGPAQDAPLRSRGFIDDEDGFVVSVGIKDDVEKLVYIPTKAERARCAEYYENLVRFVNEIICVLCPDVFTSCRDIAEAGESITFTASGSRLSKQIYRWTVTSGKITEGQGTPYITVATDKLAGKTVKATLEVSGIDPACPNTSSCETKVVARKN